MKLNIGCGSDYREGFINIDGNDKIKTDQIIDLNKSSLCCYYHENTIEMVLCNDIIEHFFHWEALQLLKDIYSILSQNGILEIRVPDIEYIINSNYPLNSKISMIYGGQDIDQPSSDMNDTRKKFPHFFCHKYGWTQQSMSDTLKSIGFRIMDIQRIDTNFIIHVQK